MPEVKATQTEQESWRRARLQLYYVNRTVLEGARRSLLLILTQALSPGPTRIIRRRCVSEYTVVTLLDRGAADSVQGYYATIHLLRGRHRASTRINIFGLDQGRGAYPILNAPASLLPPEGVWDDPERAAGSVGRRRSLPLWR